jgi:hypothetical protein
LKPASKNPPQHHTYDNIKHSSLKSPGRKVPNDGKCIFIEYYYTWGQVRKGKSVD